MQVIRMYTYKLHSTASPFWRTASANSNKDKQKSPQNTSERKVIGASYSHADILNLNNLYEGKLDCRYILY